jgi:hypothetical protein
MPTPNQSTPTPNPGDLFTEGVISTSLTAVLTSDNILTCTYEVVIDTSIPDNPYAAGEAAIELWIDGKMIEQLHQASWNVTGYPTVPGSTYAYTLSWPSNLSEIEIPEGRGKVKAVPVDPRQINLSTETRIARMPQPAPT